MSSLRDAFRILRTEEPTPSPTPASPPTFSEVERPRLIRDAFRDLDWPISSPNALVRAGGMTWMTRYLSRQYDNGRQSLTFKLTPVRPDGDILTMHHFYTAACLAYDELVLAAVYIVEFSPDADIERDYRRGVSYCQCPGIDVEISPLPVAAERQGEPR